MADRRRRRKRRNKRVFIILGSLFLLLIVILTLSSGDEEATEVTVGEVKERDITEKVTANGKIQAEVEVRISPDVSGEIVELPVKEGDRVKEGELVAKIRPDIYESALNRAEASLNNSKAQLANAKAQLTRVEARLKNARSDYERKKKLKEKGAISEAEFQQAESDYESTLAEVEAQRQTVRASRFSVQSAEASVKEARDNLDRTTIHAPRSGTITRLEVEEGERVVGTDQMSGTEMLSISELRLMEVNVEVNENDIVRVSIGDTAEVEVDAFMDRVFKGVVTEMANSASSSGEGMDEVTDFPVKVRILRSSYEELAKDSLSSPFRPGMSATVDIATKKVKDAPSVPIRAVTTREDSASKGPRAMRECLFTYDDGRAFRRFIETGIQDDEHIQILEGMEPGEEVVTGPYDAVSKELQDSSKVKKVPKEALFGKGPS